MENKNEFFRCIEIRKRLEDRIKGKVFISIVNKVISINVTGFRGLKWSKELDNIDGYMNYDDIVEQLLWEYRQFILNKFI